MSSRETKESNLYELTKKERVIYLAQEDPFLKVEKIAQLAETTSHYVRTVLSEANLSLTKLREDYAREKSTKEEQNKFLLDLLDLSELGAINSKEQNEVIVNEDYNFAKRGENELIETLLFTAGEEPLFVSSLLFSSKLSISDISQLQRIEDISVSDLEVEIKSSSQQLADILNLEEDSLLFTLKKKIYLADKFQGINIVYFSAQKFKLSCDDGLEKIKLFKT